MLAITLMTVKIIRSHGKLRMVLSAVLWMVDMTLCWYQYLSYFMKRSGL